MARLDLLDLVCLGNINLITDLVAFSVFCLTNAFAEEQSAKTSGLKFPWITKRWRDIKSAGLVDTELPVDKVILSPEEEEAYLQITTKKKEKIEPFSEEKRELILRAALKKAYGETSLHPWYPNNREMLDAYWITYESNPLRFVSFLSLFLVSLFHLFSRFSVFCI